MPGVESFLINVSNDLEAKIIESLLESYGIPTLRKYRGSGDYTSLYMGRPLMGIDIYVPEGKLEEARGLLESEITETEYMETEDISPQVEYRDNKVMKNLFRIIILLILIPTLAGILYGAYKAIVDIIVK